jgi:glutathione S-transferase
VANPPTLILGNRNSSASSLVAWLCLKKAGVVFHELVVDLTAQGAAEVVAGWSPSGKLPVLVHDGVPVWDCLAIAEYVNETFAQGALWPAQGALRAEARSLACEAHAGFPQLQHVLPMNCRTQHLELPDTEELGQEIVRIAAAWRRVLAHTHGPWLFGGFSITDAIFLPTVFRFRSHSVRLGESEHLYMRHALSDPDVLGWLSAALQERAAP